MYNSIVTNGYLASDPETKKVGDSTLSRFRMCVSPKQAKNACFVDVEFWGRTAEVVGEYLKKGRPVTVQGELANNTWEKDGKTQNKLYIRGNTFNFLSVGNTDEDGAGSGGGSKQEPAKAAAGVDDDIPF